MILAMLDQTIRSCSSELNLLYALLPGNDAESPNLLERLRTAFAQPETVNRFGGLCLGESRDLVMLSRFYMNISG
jgi:hypothetical protein